MREINIFSTQLRSQTKFYWLDQTSASETRQNSSLKISTKLFKISIKLQLQLYVQTSEPASLSTSTKILVLTHHAVGLTIEQSVNKLLTKVVIESRKKSCDSLCCYDLGRKFEHN